jgi:hypothetical protein
VREDEEGCRCEGGGEGGRRRGAGVSRGRVEERSRARGPIERERVWRLVEWWRERWSEGTLNPAYI